MSGNPPGEPTLYERDEAVTVVGDRACQINRAGPPETGILGRKFTRNQPRFCSVFTTCVFWSIPTIRRPDAFSVGHFFEFLTPPLLFSRIVFVVTRAGCLVRQARPLYHTIDVRQRVLNVERLGNLITDEYRPLRWIVIPRL